MFHCWEFFNDDDDENDDDVDDDVGDDDATLALSPFGLSVPLPQPSANDLAMATMKTVKKEKEDEAAAEVEKAKENDEPYEK